MTDKARDLLEELAAKRAAGKLSDYSPIWVRVEVFLEEQDRPVEGSR